MIRFKSCPKCLNGDLEERSDQHGRYLRCAQCGKHFEAPETQTNDVFDWAELIDSATEPIRFSIKNAFNVYMARVAK